MLSSFIIPFPAERIDNLTQTLRFLQKYHKEVIEKSEVLLMCQNRCGEVDSGFAKTTIRNFDLPCMQKSKLLNAAIRMCESDVVVFLDSDRVLPKGYFHNVISSLRPKTAVTTLKMRRLSYPVSDEQIESNRFDYQNENRSAENSIMMRNFFSGNVTMFKKDYVDMDEYYIGYGFEDHDMTALLQDRGVEFIWREETELHLYHERMTYGYGDQKKMFLDNGIRYCKKWRIDIPGKLNQEISQYTKVMI